MRSSFMETSKIITKLKELDDGVPNIISKWILLNFLMAQPKSCCLLSVDSKQIDIHRKLESCYVAAQFANISGILKLKGWGRGHDMQIILQINYKTQINQVDFKIDYFHLIDFPMLISIASLYFLRHVRRNYRSSFLLCKSEQIAQNQIQSNVDIMLRDVCVIEYAHSLSRMGFVSRNNTAHQFRFTTRMEQLPSIILNAFFISIVSKHLREYRFWQDHPLGVAARCFKIILFWSIQIHIYSMMYAQLWNMVDCGQWFDF